MIEIVAWLIPVPPLLAFGLIILFTNRSNRVSHILGIGQETISIIRPPPEQVDFFGDYRR